MPAMATIDDRFESYNVEMAEVIGGKFWKPYDAATLVSLKAKAAAAQNGQFSVARHRPRSHHVPSAARLLTLAIPACGGSRARWAPPTFA